jgi:GNAT superfamily N-acetyltransferase
MTLSETINDVTPGTSAQEVLESHFTLKPLDGAIDPVVTEGAEGWTSPNPHPVLSIMRWTTADPDTAAEALTTVLERFRAEGRGFDWMTGPRCAEAGLLPLLEEAGFIRPPLHVTAMVRTIPPGTTPELPAAPDGLQILRVENPEDSRVWRVMAEGFEVPHEVGEIFHRAYMTPTSRQNSEVYAVSETGSDVPVAVGYQSYIGDGRSVLLRVSTTLEPFRGRGIYRALVARRVHEAARRGRDRVFVHAYSGESRRALSEMGFADVGTLQLHRWRP